MAIKSIDKFVNPKKIFVDKPKKIGFIGLGRMGGAMAGHLAVAGHNVHVFNRSKKIMSIKGGGNVSTDNTVLMFILLTLNTIFWFGTTIKIVGRHLL